MILDYHCILLYSISLIAQECSLLKCLQQELNTHDIIFLFHCSFIGCVLNLGQKEDNKLSNKNDTGKNRMSFRVRPSSGDEESLLGA